METKERILRKIGIAFFLTAASTTLVGACGDSQERNSSSTLPKAIEKEVRHTSLDDANSLNAAPTSGTCC